VDKPRELVLLEKSFENSPYPHFSGHERQWQNYLSEAKCYLDGGFSPDVTFKKRFCFSTTMLDIATSFVSNFGDWSLLEKMRENGADFNFMSGDSNQESILINARLDKKNRHRVQLATYLLKNGADPTQIGASKISPIHFMAGHRCYPAEILKLFLENLSAKRIDSDVRTVEGLTPILYIADGSASGLAGTWEEAREKLEMLSSHGADLKARDNRNRDVFQIIAKSRPTYDGHFSFQEEMKKWIREKE
jgi:ankyrin repeat protein